MGERRQYSEADKAAALAALDANGGNVKKTAREVGLPRDTLKRWAHGEAVPFSVVQQGPRKRGSLADALEDIAWKCAELLPAKIEEAGPTATATTLGIAIDKMRLLRGDPTAINETRESVSHDDRARRIAGVLAGLDPGADLPEAPVGAPGSPDYPGSSASVN